MNKIAAILLILCFASCSESSKNNNEEDVASQSKSVLAEPDKIAEVTVMELKPSVFSHEIVSNGRLSADEKVDVNFPASGLIADIYVRNGQHVAKGQKIATLDTYKLQNQLDKDRNAVASAQLDMKDVIIGQGYDPEQPDKVPAEVKDLARLRSGLNQAELALQATMRELEEATLVAPISGTIANLTAKAHNMSPTSEPLCRIINDGNMEAEFAVLESELAMVKPGDAVTVAPFSGGVARQGRVSEINPMVDDNGMIKVWASVPGGNGLIDGMNVRVSVKRAVEEALVVPKTAVVLRSGRPVIFNYADGKAQWNYVTLGLENLSEYTILDGITPGMMIITSGNINLAHESPVKIKND